VDGARADRGRRAGRVRSARRNRPAMPCRGRVSWWSLSPRGLVPGGRSRRGAPRAVRGCGRWERAGL